MGNILIKSGINWGSVPNSVFVPGENGLNLAKRVDNLLVQWEHHRTNWRIFKLTIHRSPIFSMVVQMDSALQKQLNHAETAFGLSRWSQECWSQEAVRAGISCQLTRPF